MSYDETRAACPVQKLRAITHLMRSSTAPTTAGNGFHLQHALQGLAKLAGCGADQVARDEPLHQAASKQALHVDLRNALSDGLAGNGLR